MRKQWFLNKVNPNFFYDYAKMFGERSPKNHDNYVERMLNSEDVRIKSNTFNQEVKDELEQELIKFNNFKRQKTFQITKKQVREKMDEVKDGIIK